MGVNLNDMPLKELRELQAQVVKAISSFEDRRKRDAIAELDDRARALGYSFAELAGAPTKAKRAPVSAKYVNPADSSETWSGRGRKPRWFLAGLAAGKTPEDMAI